MVPRHPHSLLLLAGLLGVGMLGSCAASSCIAPSRQYVRQLDLGVELAAALVAATLRAELPFADPVPQYRGAPVTRSALGRFRVRYEHRTDGAWLPAATDRVSISMPRGQRGDLHPQVQFQSAGEMHGFGGEADLVVELELQATSSGCVVSGDLPLRGDHDFALALDRTWQLLSAPSANAPGLWDANLRAFVAHQKLRESERLTRSGEARAAELALHAAAQLGARSPGLELALGELALQSGNRAEATQRFWNVAMRSEDPTLRQQSAALAATTGHSSSIAGAQDLRRQAMTHLSHHELGAAAALLHSARRENRGAKIDYAMLEDLHLRSGDAWSAFACALLGRENAPNSLAYADLGEHLVRTGMADLAHRLAMAPAYDRANQMPGLATAGVSAPQLPGAGPPR